MADFLVGRLYAWPEFGAEGQDVWLLHLGDPAFFLRVIRRPEGSLPSGEVTDLAFPLKSDARFALGNLMFLDPRAADAREVARLLAGAIDAVHDDMVADRLALDRRPFDPVPEMIVAEDLPKGFVVGVVYEPRSGAIDPAWWIAHIGLPPFVMRVSDPTDEAVEEDDMWATVDGGAVLSHPRFLTAVACDADELRHLAHAGAEVIRESAADDMTVP
jgi:hypothetical protein